MRRSGEQSLGDDVRPDSEGNRDADLFGEVQVDHRSASSPTPSEDEAVQYRKVDEEHERVD